MPLIQKIHRTSFSLASIRNSAIQLKVTIILTKERLLDEGEDSQINPSSWRKLVCELQYQIEENTQKESRLSLELDSLNKELSTLLAGVSPSPLPVTVNVRRPPTPSRPLSFSSRRSMQNSSKKQKPMDLDAGASGLSNTEKLMLDHQSSYSQLRDRLNKLKSKIL